MIVSHPPWTRRCAPVNPAELYELLGIVGGVIAAGLRGLLLVRRARAARQPMIEGVDEAPAPRLREKPARKAREPEPEEEEESAEDAAPKRPRSPNRKPSPSPPPPRASPPRARARPSPRRPSPSPSAHPRR